MRDQARKALNLLLWLALPLPAAGAAPAGPADAASFEELVAGAEAREGLFDTYRKGEHLYLAIPPERFGREFLAVPRIARGIGARGLYGSQIYDRLEAEVVVLERHGERVFLKQVPHRFTADAGSPAAVALERSFGASVLAAAEVAATREDGAVVIDAYPWMVSDLFNVERWVRQSLGGPDRPASVSLDAERSHLEWVKVYPKNLEIRSQLTFRPGEQAELDTVPDGRFVPLSLHFSFVEPAEEAMASRPADDRMGFTLSVRKNFSRRGDPTYFERIGNRWRLEPGEAVGDVHRPRQPIVFHLDPSIPVPYRPYVQAGIEAWNSAFEAAGFLDAIRAEPLPAGADPADLRFATVTWVASAEDPFGAFGNSIVDPRSGEILDADVVMDAGFVERLYEAWRVLVAPRAAPPAEAAGGGHDGFARGLGAEVGLLRLARQARGEATTDAAALELVGQLIRHIVLHEVGHDLGLDHNFRASASTPLARLHDKTWTDEHGLAASVMDYLPVNLAPLDRPNGDYFLLDPGPYDRWAIAYLYSPDPAAAAALARQNAEAYHVYGGDIDLYAPGALDPLTYVWDLSDDPLAWSRQRTDLVRQLLPRLPEIVLDDGSTYGELTDAVELLRSEHFSALSGSVRFVGGQYASRDHVGDAGGRPPFAPVPKDVQLQALDLLTERAFGPQAFPLPPEVQRRMGARNWDHWGFSGTYDGRLDPPLHRQIRDAQVDLLEQLTDPLRLARLLDAERAFGAAAVPAIPEVLGRLTEAIWGEVWTVPARGIGAQRRDLQRAWLDRTLHLLLGEDDRLPADARSTARSLLADLSRRLGSALASGGLEAGDDPYTRSHLEESAARVEAALEAHLTATLSGGRSG